MKQRLIDRWLDLREMSISVGGNNLFILHDFKRIENILWRRYGYDVALTKTKI